jgi:hypothetical protein
MPVIPALTQKAGVAGPLTDVLDELSPDDIAELCAVASEWADTAGLGDSEVADDPEASVDTDMDTPAEEPLPGDNPVEHSEGTETLEEEASETPEEQEAEAEEGTEEFDGLLAQVQDEAGKGETLLAQFDALIETAKENEDAGGDADAIEDLKAEAEDYLSEIEGQMKEATAARKDEDANGIAQAGLYIKEKNELIQTLLDQAAVHAKTNQPPPAKAGSIPNAAPALAVWAQRYSK